MGQLSSYLANMGKPEAACYVDFREDDVGVDEGSSISREINIYRRGEPLNS